MTFVRPTIAYLGTPDVAVPPLRALVAAGFDVRVVITAPDARRGRGGATSASPVKAAAIELGLDVAHRLDAVDDATVDLGVVVAYGSLIPADLLARVPMVNLHFSLLPRWRGAAPVERAILAGDEETGVCVMEVVEALDAGGIYAVDRTPVGDKTLSELWEELSTRGAELLVSTLSHPLGAPEPQQGEVTYAHKLGPDDRRVPWAADAVSCRRVVRLGRAWTTLAGDRVLILDADVGADRDAPPGTLSDDATVACGRGSLRLRRVQPAGRAAMDADAWVRGLSADGAVLE